MSHEILLVGAGGWLGQQILEKLHRAGAPACHPGVAEQMALVADNVEGATLANCGHLCAEEKPGAFADAVRSFAARLEG